MRHELIYPARQRSGLNPGLAMRPLDLAHDIELIQTWYQMDYAHYWGMQNMTVEETRSFYADAQARGELQAAMGMFDGRPAFVMEYYDPAHHPLNETYSVASGDMGMHFFVGPPVVPIRHFTRDILRTVMAYLFDELGALRVVVEPDIRNHKVHRLNHLVGFIDQAVVELPGKQAQLAFCTPTDFAQTLRG